MSQPVPPLSPLSADSGLIEGLAGVGREAVARGLVVGSGGNLSARVAGSDQILVTAAGTWLERLTERSFARVGLADGARLSTLDPPPSTEVALHLAAYRIRPDVNAVIHLHPQATVLLDAVGQRVRLITTDHAFYVRRIATIPFFRPGTAELAEAAAAATADGTNCVILPHHGCCVLGVDVEAAWRRAVNLEEAARLTARALLLTGAVNPREVAECPVSFEDLDTV